MQKITKRKTAGELSLKASSDVTKYDPLEVGEALTEDVYEQLMLCAEAHEKIFNEDEFFIVLIIAGDPLIQNVRRHKYCALLYLPQPRPQQTVFLYNKKTQAIRRLWALPNALVMATISEMKHVAPQWKTTKSWSDAFYSGKFHEYIRMQHKIDYLTEKEFLEVNRDKLIKSGCKDVETFPADPFDFSKIMTEKIIDPLNTLSNQD